MHNLATELAARWSLFSPAPIQEMHNAYTKARFGLMRLDRIQSWTSGNKYYKLKYGIHDALTQGKDVIISKGGMFSNHLAALSDACQVFGIRLIAVIRSHGPDEMNPSIQRLRANGTEIHFATPATYLAFGPSEADQLSPGSLFIPEGGLSESGIRGTAEILSDSMPFNPTHVVVAGGTMGTACGIIASAPAHVQVIIVPAWKGCTDLYLAEILEQYHIVPACSWAVWADYHFGGFGRFNQSLVDFMTSFSNQTQVPIDPVYTGKLMYAIYDKLKSGYFGDSDAILALHTGGLQGINGYKYRFPKEWGSYLS
jgi:1-aminocyclopropane-1-carboxylate deaminase